jgi:hypothetical protein
MCEKYGATRIRRHGKQETDAGREFKDFHERCTQYNAMRPLRRTDASSLENLGGMCYIVCGLSVIRRTSQR